ncbi:MAG: NAD-dependent epimerase/dehydratase family protein, partial [Candidatus Harrisonbacteria bacterium]|nr:NAD-dependent epimerase/dehydratase family protein [Candidatus Harrisonbacteria bacterium]
MKPRTSNIQPRTILVTGCAGFIGSNFVAQFRREFPNTEIVGVDDFSTGRRDALHPSLIFYEGSILDEKLLAQIFAKHKPEYMFHFAALPRVSYSIEQPAKTTLVNIGGTVALLEAAKNSGVKRLIYSASSAAYGGAKKLPTKESENPADPKSPYALQKYTGEMFCKMFSDLYGLDTVSLRYFNVFGPGQYGDSPYSTVISAWLAALYLPKKKKAFLEGDGAQSRDFCYVDNVVRANILAMQTPRKLRGEMFNIAHGGRTTVNETRRLIEQYTGKKLKLEQRPPRLGDVRDTHADISKAKEWLGYAPEVKFEEGLKRTVR